MRTEAEARRAIDAYGDTVRRICFLNLKSHEDTEDIFQDIFLRFLMYSGSFQDAEHEKAWFIRIAINACRDLLRNFYRRNKVAIQDIPEPEDQNAESRELLQTVLALPEKYKIPLYLFYFEGYSAVEIAKLTGKPQNTVYTRLGRGRTMLKEKLGGVDFGE